MAAGGRQSRPTAQQRPEGQLARGCQGDTQVLLLSSHETFGKLVFSSLSCLVTLSGNLIKESHAILTRAPVRSTCFIRHYEPPSCRRHAQWWHWELRLRVWVCARRWTRTEE